MSEDKGKQDAGKTDESKDDPYLGTWKTREDADEGLKNLQGKLSEQGSEVGSLKQQVEQSQALMEQMQEKLQVAEGAVKADESDRAATGRTSELSKIAKQITNLDPVDEGYSKNLLSLMGQSNKIAAEQQHEQTLAAATDAFRGELDERDIMSAHQSFFGANPEFNTPEMQARIKDQIKQDQTGMADPLSAFREIERDDARAQANELKAQNEELTKRLSLKGGADATGTVITKSQGAQDKASAQPKTQGAARNQGMADILANMRSA